MNLSICMGMKRDIFTNGDLGRRYHDFTDLTDFLRIKHAHRAAVLTDSKGNVRAGEDENGCERRDI